MLEGLLLAATALLAVAVILLVVLLRRSGSPHAALASRFDQIERSGERTERSLREELAKGHEQAAASDRHLREELTASIQRQGDASLKQAGERAATQKDQLDSFQKQLTLLTGTTETRLDQLRGVVDERLQQIHEESGKKLDEMRATVDEKLQGTLEKRLGEAFQQVSERLEAVHKGLGEMQNLAAGVGDLKKVLTNVKTRGVFGEIQLGELLDSILTRDQYEQNVATRPGSADRVEFALKLPGAGDLGDDVVWLPIDAKFPQEDYHRLVDAEERADPAAADEARRALENRIKAEARKIRDKYLDPPHTTDFGIMFLPTEGLYAEVLRRPGLAQKLQQELRVVVSGPMTLAAILNSLRMGFRTLAIQKRSSEVWKLLGAVKTHFGKFNELLDNVQKKLDQASTTLETASKRSRTIERKLDKVDELPQGEAGALLPDAAEPAPADEDPEPSA